MTTTFLEMQGRVLSTIALENDADTRTKCKAWLNDAALDVWHAYAWREKRTHAFVNLVAPYSDGVVTLANDSTTLTAGAGCTFTSAMVGRKFAVDLGSPWYTIEAYVSAAELTLDRNYLEDAIGSGTYVIYEDEYLLTDMDTLLVDEVVLFSESYDYPMADLTSSGWSNTGAFPRSEGAPSAFRLIDESSGTPKIQVWPVPDDVYAVRYPYLKSYTAMVDDSDTTGMVKSRADIVVVGALREAYRLIGEMQNSALEEQRFWNLIAKAISNERKRHPHHTVLRPIDNPSGRHGRTGAFRINYP